MRSSLSLQFPPLPPGIILPPHRSPCCLPRFCLPTGTLRSPLYPFLHLHGETDSPSPAMCPPPPSAAGSSAPWTASTNASLQAPHQGIPGCSTLPLAWHWWLWRGWGRLCLAGTDNPAGQAGPCSLPPCSEPLSWPLRAAGGDPCPSPYIIQTLFPAPPPPHTQTAPNTHTAGTFPALLSPLLPPRGLPSGGWVPSVLYAHVYPGAWGGRGFSVLGVVGGAGVGWGLR